MREDGYSLALTPLLPLSPQHGVNDRDWVHGATPGHAEGGQEKVKR